MDKSIIGIVPWSNQVIPKEVQDISNAIVGWNTLSIINAIEEFSL